MHSWTKKIDSYGNIFLYFYDATLTISEKMGFENPVSKKGYIGRIGSRPTTWLPELRHQTLYDKSAGNLEKRLKKMVEFYWKAYNAKKW